MEPLYLAAAAALYLGWGWLKPLLAQVPSLLSRYRQEADHVSPETQDKEPVQCPAAQYRMRCLLAYAQIREICRECGEDEIKLLLDEKVLPHLMKKCDSYGEEE